MPAEDGPGPAAVPYRWDQCILPHGAGAGPTEEGVSYWLTRRLRHFGGIPLLLMTPSKWDSPDRPMLTGETRVMMHGGRSRGRDTASPSSVEPSELREPEMRERHRLAEKPLEVTLSSALANGAAMARLFGVGFLTMGDVNKELPNVDAPDVLERMKNSPALQMALEMSRPRNWWGVAVNPHALLAIARNEGIPLAGVPRTSIVKLLSDAPDREARVQVLEQHENEVLDDCDHLLDGCSDPEFATRMPLAHATIRAYAQGHYEAAMALAVSLGEPLAAWASTPRVTGFDSNASVNGWQTKRAKIGRYKWAESELKTLGSDVSANQFLWQILIAPIPRFFTSWDPDWGVPAPEALSRHVVAHQPTVEHFTKSNALISLMLMASILADQQDWSEEVRESEYYSGE